ncbi:hypothetical protein SDRG_05591 [Saprolegnia diclina VS20]|uniref:Uncharacterized protein n=1 Tax=Saprolegnia diclina (strain VS20) TaxID=1156394 RepID=T0QHE3_SAPDV|nr:hypothetical protein SDRG_05591 [Saprolegnia diclina VS20]EQC37374.1 hypothetical protein SDRG_05591 [Saprolegnia diclina VS20]|eukprot:XP_008609536.1 hypothetical protein SDRG_05591 [Saprolegnia diclina VS20]
MVRPPLPRPIAVCDFDAILASDKEMYPTDTPLTPEAMAQWYMFHPEFGMIYDGLGCCIVVPVTKATWTAYIRKEIDEAGLVNGVFDAATDEDGELGLHLYHIEKTPAWTRDYARMATVVLADLGRILENLRAARPKHLQPLQVVGFSALAASEAGYKTSRTTFKMTQLYEAEEFLYRHKTTRELIVVTPSDLPLDETSWVKEGETRLMALEGVAACRDLFSLSF